MTVNTAKVVALKECKGADGNDYAHRYHTAQHALPIANGKLAQFLTQDSKEKQYEAADTLFSAIKGQNTNALGRLNGAANDKEPLAALVLEPESINVRMIFSPELGLHNLASQSPLGDKLLWVQGDGNHDEGPPSCLALSLSAVKEDEFKAIGTASIAVSTNDQLNEGTKASAVQTTVKAMRVAPIPAFLAVDAIDEPVQAITILERIQDDPRLDTSVAMIHLHQWLHAAFVWESQSKEKMRISLAEMATGMKREAKMWAKLRMEKILGPKPAVPAPPVFTTPTPLPPQPTQPAPLVKAKTDKCPWSDEMLKLIVSMCGFVSSDRDSNIKAIPQWHQKLWQETHSQMQNRVIIDELEKNRLYDDVCGVSNPEVLDTIRGAKFFAGDSHNDRSLLQAAKYLSVFSCVRWLEDAMEDYRDYEERKEEVTFVTFSDVKKKSKKAQVPSTFLEFIEMLKMYANTLYACFGEDCTMVKLVQSLLKKIFSYHQDGREKIFDKKHKAHILWIVYLQGREWAKGEGKTMQIWKTMIEKLATKSGQVTFVETPAELFEQKKGDGKNNDGKKKAEEGSTPPGSPTKATKRNESQSRDARLAVINSAVQTAMTKAPAGKKWVPITAICKMCKYWPTDNQTQRAKCLHYMLLGECKQKRCERKHEDMHSSQVPEALEGLKPFLEEPELVWEQCK